MPVYRVLRSSVCRSNQGYQGRPVGKVYNKRKSSYNTTNNKRWYLSGSRSLGRERLIPGPPLPLPVLMTGIRASVCKVKLQLLAVNLPGLMRSPPRLFFKEEPSPCVSAFRPCRYSINTICDAATRHLESAACNESPRRGSTMTPAITSPAHTLRWRKRKEGQTPALQ